MTEARFATKFCSRLIFGRRAADAAPGQQPPDCRHPWMKTRATSIERNPPLLSMPNNMDDQRVFAFAA